MADSARPDVDRLRRHARHPRPVLGGTPADLRKTARCAVLLMTWPKADAAKTSLDGRSPLASGNVSRGSPRELHLDHAVEPLARFPSRVSVERPQPGADGLPRTWLLARCAVRGDRGSLSPRTGPRSARVPRRRIQHDGRMLDATVATRLTFSPARGTGVAIKGTDSVSPLILS